MNHPWKTADDLLKLAEEADQPPPPPEDGIPKQKIPGWIRWPIRAFFLPFVLLDLAAKKIAAFFFRFPYKRTGSCQQRGNCCYYIVAPAPTSFLKKLYFFWNTEINGFYPRHKGPALIDGAYVTVMGCRYLQQNGKCGQYRLRPAVCREWPQIEWFGPPKILKGCGFKAEKNTPASKNKLNILD